METFFQPFLHSLKIIRQLQIGIIKNVSLLFFKAGNEGGQLPVIALKLVHFPLKAFIDFPA